MAHKILNFRAMVKRFCSHLPVSHSLAIMLDRHRLILEFRSTRIIWSGSPYESCPSNSGKAYLSVLASVVTHAWTRCAWCSSEAVRPIRRPDVSVKQAPTGDWIEKSKEKKAILIWSMFFAAQIRKLLEELADDLSIAKVIGTVGTSRRQSRKLFRVVIH